jgi:hypothetical protein
VPVEVLRGQLNRFGAPEFETVASRGEGILPALREITRLVVKDLKSRQPHRPPPRPARQAVPALEVATRTLPPAAAPATPPSPPASASAPATRTLAGGLSLARLFGERGSRVAEVELLVRERSFGKAARRAGEAVAEVLAALSAPEATPAARALLLGLDGRDYLRLGRLAALPEAQVSERDALFALHLLVSAMLRADGL